MKLLKSKVAKGMIVLALAVMVVLALLFYRKVDSSVVDENPPVSSSHSKVSSSLKDPARVAVSPTGIVRNAKQVASSKSPSITIKNLRSVLDESFSGQDAVYTTHEPIISPNGNTQSVSFVYAIQEGESSPPSLEEISKKNVVALEQQRRAYRKLADAIENDDQKAMRQAAKAQVWASRKLARENDYYTVDLALSRDDPPVLMFRKGLPAWIALQKQAQSVAIREADRELRLSSIMRTSPISKPVFVFSDAGNDRVYVDARSMAIHTSPPRSPQQKSRTNRPVAPGRAARVSTQWQAFFAEGLDISRFSFEKLKDLSKKN